MNIRLTTIAILTAMIFTSCDLYEQDEYVEQYVVESYLIAGKGLPQVRLTTTASFDREYLPNEVSVSDAVVHIHLLSEDGTRQTTYEYSETRDGVYEKSSRNNIFVEEKRTYELDITLPGSDNVISAQTTVPGKFEVLSVDRDTSVYQTERQLQATFSSSYYPGRQSYYIFATEALEPDNYDITPFWKMADNDRSSLTLINSGIINEENYRVEGDKLILRYPWLGIAYYGPNEINTYAIDDNVYDFHRSHSVQLGGSTLSPGEIPNIIYNVEGAIGLFGSMAGASVRVYVKKAD